MPYGRLVITALCVALLIIRAPRAAEVTFKAVDGLNVVFITGDIVQGDAEKFRQIAASIVGPTGVSLNSRGGSVIEGLEIGEIIQARQFVTAVTTSSTCASSCGLIWLSGAKRYASSSAHVGFHAAYVGSGVDAKEIGSGNALIGAYLNKLGLSYDAVFFVTSAPPDEIRWLQPADALKVGIQYVTIPDPVPEPPLPARAPVISQVLPDGTPAEQRMMSLIISYYALWSRPGVEVDGLNQYYSDNVAFYGSTIPRAKLMDEKRKFSLRWSERHYTVRTSTLFAQCSDTCSVTGVVEWDVNSAERGAHSVGAANFVFKIAPNGSQFGGVILSENGSVLSSHSDTTSAPQAVLPLSSPVPGASTPTVVLSPEQQLASVTTAYTEGRQARIGYEQWFAALPEGPYREGATFWAANRSVKPTPPCSGGNDAWRDGCSSNRARLTPVDLRRKSDKNYWWGWNSL